MQWTPWMVLSWMDVSFVCKLPSTVALRSRHTRIVLVGVLEGTVAVEDPTLDQDPDQGLGGGTLDPDLAVITRTRDPTVAAEVAHQDTADQGAQLPNTTETDRGVVPQGIQLQDLDLLPNLT